MEDFLIQMGQKIHEMNRENFSNGTFSSYIFIVYYGEEGDYLPFTPINREEQKQMIELVNSMVSETCPTSVVVSYLSKCVVVHANNEEEADKEASELIEKYHGDITTHPKAQLNLVTAVFDPRGELYSLSAEIKQNKFTNVSGEGKDGSLIDIDIPAWCQEWKLQMEGDDKKCLH